MVILILTTPIKVQTLVRYSIFSLFFERYLFSSVSKVCIISGSPYFLSLAEKLLPSQARFSSF